MQQNINKITVGVLVAVLLTNPLTGQYIYAAFDYAFKEGAWVTLLGCLYGFGLIGYGIWNGQEKLNVPKKTARTKTSKFLEV